MFHPDKQADEARKEAATRQFLEVQKAYEGACCIVSLARTPSQLSPSSPVRPSNAVRSFMNLPSRDPCSCPIQSCI